MRQPLAIDPLSKILVIRNQNPVLCKRFPDHFLIVNALCFLIDGKNVVLLNHKPARNGRSSAFIDEKSHAELLQAERHEICVVERSRSKKKTRLNVRLGKAFVFLEDLLGGASMCQKVQDVLNGEARPLDHGLASHDSWVDGNSRE